MKAVHSFILMFCSVILLDALLAIAEWNIENRPKTGVHENVAETVLGIPLSEAETFISDWLSGNGFVTRRIEENIGRVTITGTKDNEQWHIFLQSKSPLSTRFRADYAYKDIPDAGTVQTLKEQIIRHFEGPEVIGDNSPRYIPSVVLSRIESVVCLESIIKNEPVQFSGFVVDTGGLVLSTAHDLKGHQRLNIILFDGSKSPGQVIKADHQKDLALIRVDVKFTDHC
jgi:S1-C subfamily serine protease